MKEKLLELIKNLKLDITEKEFSDDFYGIYGTRYKEEGFEGLLKDKKKRIL